MATQLAHSSSYHPQSDGQTEIVNKCLEGYLRYFASEKQTQWVKWLPFVEWWYNTSFHMASKMSPFMELYGYHPPSIISPLKGNSKFQVVQDHLQKCAYLVSLSKATIITFFPYDLGRPMIKSIETSSQC